MKKTMTALVAMTRNRVIGLNGKIPWHLPEDLRWFKEKTMGGALLMGRKTYESIGRPLPGRETFVVSRTAEIDGVQMVRDLAGFNPAVTERPVFVVGGGEIYAQTLTGCGEIFVTLVDVETDGDAWMPEFESDFPEVETFRMGEGYRILRYQRSVTLNKISI